MNEPQGALALYKKELRAEQAAARSGLSPELRERYSNEACANAAALLRSRSIGVLSAYVSFRSELNTRPLIEDAWHGGRHVLLPKIKRADRTMTMHEVWSWDGLTLSDYGILEPAGLPVAALPPVPSAVFVPGLAFDSRGGRLGYGGGYYDRLYASWNSLPEGEARPLWIGLAFAAQLLPGVPMDTHDARMDLIITEEGIIECRRTAG